MNKKYDKMSSKVTLSVNDTILYLKEPQGCTENFLDLINTFSNATR